MPDKNGFAQSRALLHARKNRPCVGFNWLYDSGLVAFAVPDFASALAFDGDQQAAIGLFCNGPGGKEFSLLSLGE